MPQVRLEAMKEVDDALSAKPDLRFEDYQQILEKYQNHRGKRIGAWSLLAMARPTAQQTRPRTNAQALYLTKMLYF